MKLIAQFVSLGLALQIAAPLVACAAPTPAAACTGPRRAQGLCTPVAAGGLQPFRKPQQPYAIGTPALTPRSPATPALIEAQRFRKVSQGLGEWSGIVRGSGEVRLALQIIEHGRVTATRWIGSVILANEPSTFHFRGPVPSVPGWDWRIIAANSPGSRNPMSP